MLKIATICLLIELPSSQVDNLLLIFAAWENKHEEWLAVVMQVKQEYKMHMGDIEVVPH